ncbi:PqqD family peptide modification chaperone [Paenibacillus soyae]|uniref:PqqD family peptide modification chaperone n=1 Tax=Paenibacillus soyae TaxID=2969249 RepID=A0A9X2MVU3_9BACL|nr:PqqD family peptide modification chaperone [Paenibacillus soyae]MCR2807405.1 PqqD family peptide modification chaperone [Paenibacillus soyae]
MQQQSIQLTDTIAVNEDVLATELDGEISMLHIDSGNYYTLDGVSSDIWLLAKSPITVQSIVSRLLDMYDVDEPTCTAQTIEFIHNLVYLKLIRIVA